jgi:hypothetical protein
MIRFTFRKNSGPKNFAKSSISCRREMCEYAGFIVSGAIRMFTVDQKGHEHILKFAVEEWWAVDHESFMLLTPKPLLY